MKNKQQKSRQNRIWLIVIVLIVFVFIFLSYGQLFNQNHSSKVKMDNIKSVEINIGNDLYITSVGNYAGVYMEDGSDENVSDILMIVVENRGNTAVQYAEIIMPTEKEDAFFTMSTSLPGSRMILLEQNRKKYVNGDYKDAFAENIAVFQENLSVYSDKINIQALDEAMNVTNISDKDINGDVIIYYKNSSEDVFYGGITYRVRIEGGIRAGEMKQIMANHFSGTGSKVMFITIGE